MQVHKHSGFIRESQIQPLVQIFCSTHSIHTHTHIHIHTHTRTHTHTHTHTDTYTHTHTQTHTHARTHAHTHARTHSVIDNVNTDSQLVSMPPQLSTIVALHTHTHRQQSFLDRDKTTHTHTFDDVVMLTCDPQCNYADIGT